MAAPLKLPIRRSPDQPLNREQMYEALVNDPEYQAGMAADLINLDTQVGGTLHRETLRVCTGYRGTCTQHVCEGVENCAAYAEVADACPPGYTGPRRIIDTTEPASPVTNPKEGAGAQKPPTWSVFPRWVMLAVGRVMQIGAAKYDAFNYREAPVQAMTYVDAIERHLQLWQDGEDIDEETGESHLASVISGCGILMDTQALGNMIDNRPRTGLVRQKLDELVERAKVVPLPPKNPNAPSMRRAPTPPSNGVPY